MGIWQNMVNPSLVPTQPEGSELPTFGYGGEGIPRGLKQYRFSPYGYIFPNTVKLSTQSIRETHMYTIGLDHHWLR